MPISKKKTLAIGLLVILSGVIGLSLLTLRMDAVPAPLALVLLPGQLIDMALGGGNIHSAERDSTVFLNILLWSAVIGGVALFLFRSDS